MPPILAPDASDDLIRRTHEWQTLNRAQIGERMREASRDIDLAVEKIGYSTRLDELMRAIPVWVQDNAVAREISTVIDTELAGIRQAACRRILHLFVFVDRYAATWAEILNAIPQLPRREAIFKYIDGYIARRLSPGDVVEAQYRRMVIDTPDTLNALLTQAMAAVDSKWGALASPAHRRKFVEDIFDSPKGYSKSASAIWDWTAPTDFAFAPFMESWLRGPTNTSIYDPRVTSATKARRQWIIDAHASASAEQRRDMWVQFATQLGGAMDRYQASKLVETLAANRVVFREKLPAAVPTGEIDSLIATDLAKWWAAFS